MGVNGKRGEGGGISIVFLLNFMVRKGVEGGGPEESGENNCPHIAHRRPHSQGHPAQKSLLCTKIDSTFYLYLTITVLDEGKSFLLQYLHPLAHGTKPGAPKRGIYKFDWIAGKEVFAMLREIEIKNEAQVEKINQLACKAPYEVWLFTKDVMLDARSLLGLFSLVGKKASVVVEDDVSPSAFSRLVAKMA